MNDIHPINPPIELEVFSEKMISFALFFLLFLVLLLLLLVFIYFKKKKNNLKSETKVSDELYKEVDHYEIAKDKLEKIKKYLEKDEFKIFQLEISKIIRIYLSGAFEENFTKKTSSEILQSEKINSEIRDYLKKFFNVSDREKFSTLKQERARASEVYDLALLIIQKK